MDLDIFSIFLILGGAYLLYTAVLLIKDRKVTPSVMLSPGTVPEAIKDLDGFIRFNVPADPGCRACDACHGTH
jgi:hypothetical protein